MLITDYDNHRRFSKDPQQFFVCSNEFCDWRGGFYDGRMEDLEYIENCKCGGILIVKNGTNGHFLGCTMFGKYGGCRNSSNLKKEIKKKYDEIYGINKKSYKST